jgi:nucleoporin GLE1
MLSQTQDIHQDLCSVLNRQVSAAEPVLFSRELPIAYLYLLSHISKALLHQAENEVLAKSEAAFPLAKLVTGLMLRGHAALGEILISRFVKKCPWVLPFYPARREVSLVKWITTG